MENADPEQFHHIEIRTVMEKVTEPTEDEIHSLPLGKKLTKSRSFGHEQKQRRKRERFTQKQPSFAEQRSEPIGVTKGELSDMTVLTENLDSMASSDYIKTRFPPILQAKETKSLLKRKKGTQKQQTASKEFLPSLNIKANLNEKIVKRSQVNHLPSLTCNQGLTGQVPPSSPESASESLPPTPSLENAPTMFSDFSPNIPRKKPPKTYGPSIPVESPPSPRRPTPFPSIWGEERFFMISIGSNVISEKAKAYIVKEESE